MFEFKIWRESTSKDKPLVVFIPGFLTEDSVKNNNAWVDQLLLFAIEKDYSIGAVLWDSQTPSKILDMDSFNLTSISVSLIERWSDTSERADSLVKHLVDMTSYFKDKKTILIGHSLGARIALKAVETCPLNTFHSVVAMAPACTQDFCDFEKIRKNTKRKPIVLFSAYDRVLDFLFPTAQNKNDLLNSIKSTNSTTKILLAIGTHYFIHRHKNAALGFVGIESSSVNNINASNLLKTEVGHLTYEKLIKKILLKIKL